MIVRHSPRCPTRSRTSTERREDVQSKRHDIEIRGAVKPARANTHGEAPPAGLLQNAGLENELQDQQRRRAVPKTVSSTSLFGMTWLVLSDDDDDDDELNIKHKPAHAVPWQAPETRNVACAVHETLLQPKPLNRRIPERENGAVDRKSASLGRWGVFMW